MLGGGHRPRAQRRSAAGQFRGEKPRGGRGCYKFLDVMPFLCGNFGGYTDPSALLHVWLAGAGFSVANLPFPLVVNSLRLAVAPAAGLEALGINEVEISDERIKSLKIWRTAPSPSWAAPV